MSVADGDVRLSQVRVNDEVKSKELPNDENREESDGRKRREEGKVQKSQIY